MNERQQAIFDLIQQAGRISVQKLAGTLYVSQMTIRRDLAEMERSGLLRRYRGGALSNIREDARPIADRMVVGEEEKRELAKKAEKYLRDGLSVYIDSSSTCTFIIPYLKKYKEIRLLTNSVKSLLYAAEAHIPVMLLGGDYYPQDMCLIGPLAERDAEEINVDVAFFSTQSLADDGVISDSDLHQVQVRKMVMKNARQVVFLFETGKLHRKSLYTVCQAEAATEILLPDPPAGMHQK